MFVEYPFLKTQIGPVGQEVYMFASEKRGCEECAQLDIALEEPAGLCGIDHLPTAKRILMQIAVKLSTDDLLVRISHSQFAVELLRFLPHVYGPTKDNLRPVADLLFEKGSLYFDSDELGEFADLYWKAIILDRLSRKDYERCFDEIKRSFRGLRVDPNSPTTDPLFDMPEQGEAEDMAASIDCVCNLIGMLHQAMVVAGLLRPNTPQVMRMQGYYRDSPGGLFAAAISCKNHSHHSRSCNPSIQVTEIATYLNGARRERRKKKQVRELDKFLN